MSLYFNYKTAVFSIALVLLLSACVTRPVGRDASPEPVANLDPGTRVTLPSPALTSPPPPLHREQLLRTTVNGRTHTLHAVLDADGRKLTLAGLSPMGLRLFLLTYEDGRITAEKLPALPASLPPPAQVLADIMLAWWPLESWAPRLPAGWTLADDSPARRVLRDPDGNPVAEIHYRETGPAAAPRRADPVLVRHHSFGYEIRLTTLTDD